MADLSACLSWPRLACLAALLLSAGCSKNQVGKITGAVSLNGKPVAHADVTFWAKDEPDLGSYGTRTGEDGRFELFQDPRPGVYIKPGRYVVVVAKLGGAPKEDEPAAVAADDTSARNLLPPRYGQKDNSPLIVDVAPGDNHFELELKSGR